MLTHPHIQIGLRFIKGRAITRSRFFLEEKDPDIKNFLIQNLTRFWMFSAERAFTALEWGFSGSECLYRMIEGKYYFNMIKNFHATDARVVTNKDGDKIGIKVSNVPSKKGKVYLGGLKSLWHIQGRQHHPWYGRSILFGAFEPWFESSKDGGGRDIRNLYFYKYAFAGESLYYPPGTTVSSDGTTEESLYILNRDIAREIVEKRRSGAVAVFPNERDENGNLSWQWVPSTPGPGSAPILEYNGDYLKTEILEGMGIPREVIEAAETGSGYSGRAIPMEAFDSTLQDYVNWLVHDFDEQILRPLVKINFGVEASHNINPFGLSRGTVSDLKTERNEPDTIPFGQTYSPSSPEIQTDNFGIVYFSA